MALVKIVMMSVYDGRLLYLSLWGHLLLGGRKLLLQTRGRARHCLVLLGVSFQWGFLFLIRVYQAILGEMGHLRSNANLVTPEKTSVGLTKLLDRKQEWTFSS